MANNVKINSKQVQIIVSSVYFPKLEKLRSKSFLKLNKLKVFNVNYIDNRHVCEKKNSHCLSKRIIAKHEISPRPLP